MTEDLNKQPRRKKVIPDELRPIYSVQEGAILATVTKSQSRSGYAYLDFDISRTDPAAQNGTCKCQETNVCHTSRGSSTQSIRRDPRKAFSSRGEDSRSAVGAIVAVG